MALAQQQRQRHPLHVKRVKSTEKSEFAE